MKSAGFGRRCVMWAVLLANASAHAHSASDAYLTLTVQDQKSASTGAILHAQWDIALRDLDFVLGLDDDGDGKIRWGELRHHQEAIAQYAFKNIQFSAGGENCRLRLTRQAVDYHADGAYAALFFDVLCDVVAPKLAVNYSLFFGLDPSHRGIFVLHSGDKVATALLAPANAKIDPAL